MTYGIKVHVWGEYACFTRPEMKAERVSYDVMTPSAARGLLEAIYWKPQFCWVIDRIHVLKPILFESIRRNEIANKIPRSKANSDKTGIDVTAQNQRQQRASLVLRDVAYVIEAHFKILDYRFEQNGRELSENECAGKHLDIFNRRARKGQYFHHPYLGCREFPADFSLISSKSSIPTSELSEADSTKDLGFILHDIDFVQDQKTKEVKNTTARFFRAKMENGLIEVPPLNQALA